MSYLSFSIFHSLSLYIFLSGIKRGRRQKDWPWLKRHQILTVQGLNSFCPPPPNHLSLLQHCKILLLFSPFSTSEISEMIRSHLLHISINLLEFIVSLVERILIHMSCHYKIKIIRILMAIIEFIFLHSHISL